MLGHQQHGAHFKPRGLVFNLYVEVRRNVFRIYRTAGKMHLTFCILNKVQTTVEYQIIGVVGINRGLEHDLKMNNWVLEPVSYPMREEGVQTPAFLKQC